MTEASKWGDVIAVDLDGTILNQDYCEPGNGMHGTAIRPLMNKSVWQGLRKWKKPVAIVTNQGGLNWAGSLRGNGGVYPTPELVAWRIESAVTGLRGWGINVVAVRVSCYHERAKPEVTL